MKIAILQPLIPHYRESFVKELQLNLDIDLYIYQSNKDIKKNGIAESSLKYKNLKSFSFLKKIFIYNLFPLLNNKYSIIVVPGELRSLSTWLLLFISLFRKQKVILWGHGISIPNYLQEEQKLSTLRVFFHKLADQVWLYTDKEKEIWSKYINSEKLISLNNSIDTTKILNLPILDKDNLKKKYNIQTSLNLIYCARFTKNRRVDLMLELIEKLQTTDIGLIIIGEGDYKPDFSNFKNVFDFGAVYNETLKHELFTIADLYFQPAWTGLSIVEAMAYGKPILTFKRTETILQCVEYSYIRDDINGKIFLSTDELYYFLTKFKPLNLVNLQKSTIKFVESNLTQKHMIDAVINAIKELNETFN